MKKIMSLMLGLSLILGATAVFAQDKPATDSSKSTKKGKKKSSTKKKTTTPVTEKKS